MKERMGSVRKAVRNVFETKLCYTIWQKIGSLFSLREYEGKNEAEKVSP